MDEAIIGSAAFMASSSAEASGKHPFGFVDHRGRYLSFVRNTTEKWGIAERVILELSKLHHIRRGRSPLKLFDAGIGEGTVLTQVLSGLHNLFPKKPFYVVGKEVSTEDIRLVLEKIPDRLFEHPEMLMVLTNQPYERAPWLSLGTEEERQNIIWKTAPLEGSNSYQLKSSIRRLEPFIDENWKTKLSKNKKHIIPERPVVLVLYRADCQKVLEGLIPANQNNPTANFDLALASHPYAAEQSLKFKVEKVISPLAHCLAPGGRLVGIHAKEDAAMEMVRMLYPDHDPFQDSAQKLLDATQQHLAATVGGKFSFEMLAPLQYRLRSLADNAAAIGTSHLYTLWDLATYITQLDDASNNDAVSTRSYIEATQGAFEANRGPIYFEDEVYAISREFEEIPRRAVFSASLNRLRQSILDAVAG